MLLKTLEVEFRNKVEEKNASGFGESQKLSIDKRA